MKESKNPLNETQLNLAKELIAIRISNIAGPYEHHPLDVVKIFAMLRVLNNYPVEEAQKYIDIMAIIGEEAEKNSIYISGYISDLYLQSGELFAKGCFYKYGQFENDQKNAIKKILLAALSSKIEELEQTHIYKSDSENNNYFHNCLAGIEIEIKAHSSKQALQNTEDREALAAKIDDLKLSMAKLNSTSSIMHRSPKTSPKDPKTISNGNLVE